MADALIETAGINPYEGIVTDTTNQINSVQSDIQKVSDAISKLEATDPTHYLLPQLRERLAELQTKVKTLSNTNDSAKTLLTSYNESLSNAATMEWVYRLKQAELNRAQEEANRTYNQMYDDVKRSWENYINALWNATASENAIINANAWRQWASAQSTAEARARNYLANAQAQAEANANMVANLNAINDSRLNSNAWYVQLSQSNADNTLRQQVMNNYEAQMNAANNAARYWWWYWYWWWGSSWVTLPNTNRKNWWQWGDLIDPYDLPKDNWENQWYVDTEQDKKVKQDASDTLTLLDAWAYWKEMLWTDKDAYWLYHNHVNWKVTYNKWWNDRSNWLNQWWSSSYGWDSMMIDLDRWKTNDFLKEWNDKWNLNATTVTPTDKWYLVFRDDLWNVKVAHANDLIEWWTWKVTMKQWKDWQWVIRKTK